MFFRWGARLAVTTEKNKGSAHMLLGRNRNLRFLKRRIVLGLLGSTLAFGYQASDAQAQMRTGRSTRDLYSNSPTKPAMTEDEESESAVQPASYSEAPAKRTKQRTQRTAKSAVRQASHASHVVQASCPDCQGGGGGGHVLEEPGEYVSVGDGMGCDSCGSFDSCDPCDPCDDRFMPSATGGFDPCDPCQGNLFSSLLQHLHFRVEAAQFYQTASNLPALVTGGPQATAQNVVGQIGRTDTTFLLGNSPTNTNPVLTNRDGRTGFRTSIGSWLDRSRSRGILFRAYDTGAWDTNFLADQTINPVMTRPFFDVTANAQSTALIAYPNVATGNVDATIYSRSYGGDLLVRRSLGCGQGSRWEFLMGYQRAQLNDRLRVSSTTTAVANGTILNIQDRFDTENSFNGVAFGLNSFSRFENWSLDSMFKLGFGNMERDVSIAGFRRTTVSANNIAEESQGLLARNTNSGNTTSDTFAVVPELNLNLGYRFTYRLDLTLGYSFLALPKVARSADQIDDQLRSNLSNPLVGDIAPLRSFAERSYMLHSLNYGLQWRY
jgi:Putative beta barrel porin-7 (BBP7)